MCGYPDARPWWQVSTTSWLGFCGLLLSFIYLNFLDVIQALVNSEFDSLSQIYIAYIGWPRTVGTFDGDTWRVVYWVSVAVNVAFAMFTIVGFLVAVESRSATNVERRFSFACLFCFALTSAVGTYLAAHSWQASGSVVQALFALGDAARTFILVGLFLSWHYLFSIAMSFGRRLDVHHHS